ncbi:CENP-S associating centromere protein X-domain-containing protein [Annulohypoxylon truncatum]|uniref:CENP-S associating centromere protein X-domain-containing protein n=1 Tax=Annulohypoxylon truncatum TaxID=327061 RepID=UPI002007D934|nr:CENP-S associating centromere protein X-domain-containing protein [Annulohypoxylon truncatum]KAI1210480.1 CENP-S associating centromere protein X-domain-containing protein [Annulohypoxylon truncatum]
MPPKQSSTSTRGRGASSAASRSTKASKAQASTTAGSSSRARGQSLQSPQQVIGSDEDPFAEDERSQQQQGRGRGRGREDDAMEVDDERGDGEESEEEERKTIPPELLTHVLHQFFEKDGTRVSKDANAAIAKYMDIFVREAIARTVVEKEKGFLEVEDLEKVAPQLLLDL